MEDRYNLTREENLFLARKRWDESIYSGMRMENRMVTFPQTQTILEGINVAEVGLSDVQAILNMRDAWKYLLAHVEEPLSIDYLCNLQERVAYREALEWGQLRTGSIGTSGVDYVPPVPDKDAVTEELNQLLHTDISATERALNLFTWIARSQLFWDGNKRTAILAANKILIEHGAGILLVPDSVMSKFGTLLSNYYEEGAPQRLKSFLYNKAIFGIDYPSEQEEARERSLLSSRQEEPERRTSAWLKNLRKQKKLTQKDLAEAIGVAPNSIANIEQGQRKGSDETWRKIETFLG